MSDIGTVAYLKYWLFMYGVDVSIIVEEDTTSANPSSSSSGSSTASDGTLLKLASVSGKTLS